jgi:hypothetical protein
MSNANNEEFGMSATRGESKSNFVTAGERKEGN